MTDNRLNVFCLVDGEPKSNAFSVKIDPTETVDSLKNYIKAKKTPEYDDIAADKLTLWRVSVPDDDDNDNDERPILVDKVPEKKKLKATHELSAVFEEKPLKNTIHILVQHPPLAQRSTPARDLDPIATFTVTINGITRKTVEWITTPKTATLDHLRKVIYDKHPTLCDRSQTIVYEYDNAPGYILTDSDLQSHVRMSVRDGVQHLVLRLENPPKLFSDITLDDTFRLYGVHVDPPQPFDDARTISFTLDKYTQALDNLYITLEAAIASMPPGDNDVSGSQYYTNAFLMHAVALFPELKMKPGKKLRGRRAYGTLDYAVESKEDPSRILAVTTFGHLENGRGVAQNVVQVDTILSNRKRKRDDNYDDANDVDDIAPIHRQTTKDRLQLPNNSFGQDPHIT
ncbi:hypothetical protein BGX28_000580 [Mortierella sp. GBA30]|nr:hypothetical protein BGX28_000580 [Mortierella sp. GBA30]